MPDLSTNYLNLKLKNPLIAASSGLTKSLDSLQKLYDLGIGAIVLKSFFEESFAKSQLSTSEMDYHPQIYENSGYESDLYLSLGYYCELISLVRSKFDIPIIASINCISANKWFNFAKRLESAGADALELNVFNYASSRNFASPNIEKIYLDIVKGIKQTVSIPISIKISQNFSSIPYFASSLERNGIDGLVLFNRFSDLDIDLETLKFRSSFEFSHRHEFYAPLRWIAILSGLLKCDLSASGGVKGHEEVIKFILAGASSVQLASLFYQKGADQIPEILANLEEWMRENNFPDIDSMKGKVNFESDNEGSANYYMRSLFMKKIITVE